MAAASTDLPQLMIQSQFTYV